MLEERLHGAQGCVGERATNALGFVVSTIEMLLVVEALELVMIGLDLSLRRTTQKSIAFGEF